MANHITVNDQVLEREKVMKLSARDAEWLLNLLAWTHGDSSKRTLGLDWRRREPTALVIV